MISFHSSDFKFIWGEKVMSLYLGGYKAYKFDIYGYGYFGKLADIWNSNKYIFPTLKPLQKDKFDKEYINKEKVQEENEYIIKEKVQEEKEYIISACPHERKLFDLTTRNEIVIKLLAALDPYKDKFDAIVVSGYSMALIAPIIADNLQKNLVLVRKESECRHSSYVVEGVHYQKCLFLDDLICSGDTFNYVKTQLERINCEIVAICCYVSSIPYNFTNTYICINAC